jgi:hypothetical protein
MMDENNKVEEQPVAAVQDPVPVVDPAPTNPKPAASDSANVKLTLVIIVATVICLVLIGAGYMLFADADTEETPNTPTPDTAQTTQTEEVDSATIDQESAAIDGIINELDDDADFSEDELADQNLGL